MSQSSSTGSSVSTNNTSKQRKTKVQWSASAEEDLIDIVCAEEDWVKKLITHSNNLPTGPIYEKIHEKMVERNSRYKKFSPNSLRSKLKKLLCIVNGTIKTAKTETGINRVVEERGYGTWFATLQQRVAERPSNQPDAAVEPGMGSDNTPKRGKKRKAEDILIETIDRQAASTAKLHESITTLSNNVAQTMSGIKDIFAMMAQNQNQQQQQQQPYHPPFPYPTFQNRPPPQANQYPLYPTIPSFTQSHFDTDFDPSHLNVNEM